MSSSTFSVKAQLVDDIRRVRIPTDIAGAASSLGATFATDAALIRIYWTDEDGDLITIKTDDDLQEAIRSGATRLIIKKGASHVATTAVATTASAPAAVAPTPPAPTQTPTPAAAAQPPPFTPTPPAPAAPPAPAQPAHHAVHHGVVCDISGMNPIKGTRYQMAGYDYDLCEAEFNKLSADDKSNYVTIATPGAEPARYQPEAARKEAAAAPTPTAAATTATANAAEQQQPQQSAAEAEEAVHHHVTCDTSGMNPIRGVRYHLAGVNYDLCEAEFNKLSEAEKAKFVVIRHRGDRPTPYGQEPAASGATAEEGAELEGFLKQIFGVDAAPTIHQIKLAFEDVNAEVAKKFAEHQATSAGAAAQAAPAEGGGKFGPRGGGGCPMRGGGGMSGGGGGCPMRGGRWAGRHAGGHNHHGQHHRHRQQHGGWHQQHVANASVSLGDRLPAGPLGFRSFGPGVAQLQIALIKAGVLDESAIRMHTGKYGPRTAEAVYSLQEKYSLGGEPGVFDDSVAATVIATLDNTAVEPAAAPEPAVEVEVAPAPAPAPAPVETSAPPSKWQSELDVLAGMGFTDEAALVPLLEKHAGSIIFVMTELLG